MRIVVAALLGLCVSSASASEEMDFCALVSTVPSIGYITLYDGPGDRFGQRAKLVLDDFLYADTSRCSIWNDGECTDRYTHVFSVHRIDGAPRDNMHGYTSGWVYTKNIRTVDCDRDWGYPDPDWPKLEASDIQ
ncbi:MAG: hypothetical protein WAM77_12655 [Xanthobacteraceae bacterium]